MHGARGGAPEGKRNGNFRHGGRTKEATRAARDSLYRFMTATVGNAPGYEEAIRALYAGQRDEFMAHIEAWPPDICAKLESLTAPAFD